MTNSDFRPGSRVGDYVLDSYIGGGGFGAVWRGHAEGSGEAVAIKLLTGALSTGPTSSMRADVELLAAAAAGRSPHVVKVLGGGVEPVPFVVMELIEGSDLQTLIESQGRLSVHQTIDVGLALADALRALNQVGIIHRDIKPANVMIDTDSVIKLADFGIAKIAGYSGMTMTGQTAMTMAYAAPEIWDDDGAFGRPSHRSDLYAMAVLLYQCLVGMPPFMGNYGALYKAHKERPPDLEALPVETPPSMRILIRRCLEKRQDDRPRDAVECLALVRRAQVELDDANGAPSIEPRKLGPWLKDSPHPIVPWAWRCHHERTGELATVELYFADTLDAGERLTRAVEANAALTPLGAERLIESNRLLLYPGESWQAAPESEFQFWVAREDRTMPAASSVNETALRNAVPAIARLIEAAAEQGILLDVGHDNLTVFDAGNIYLRRPGLSTPGVGAEESAVSALAALPLDERAKRLVDMANSFRDLVAILSPLSDNAATVMSGSGDATQLAKRPRLENRDPGRRTVGRRGASGWLSNSAASNAGAGDLDVRWQALRTADSRDRGCSGCHRGARRRDCRIGQRRQVEGRWLCQGPSFRRRCYGLCSRCGGVGAAGNAYQCSGGPADSTACHNRDGRCADRDRRACFADSRRRAGGNRQV